MNDATDALRRERVTAVRALVAARVPAPQQALIESIAPEYFAQLDADDLAARTPEDLLGSLLSHWQFAATREPGSPKVRVFSPSVAEQGWSSRHTVVEIVNDDMPFLVDSATMEVNRQGLTLHLIAHPM